jgi:hypothetical protein
LFLYYIFLPFFIFATIYYIFWKYDERCFVFNDKLNPPSANIIRENFIALIHRNNDELPYDEKRLEELLNEYIKQNKIIDEHFRKSNSIVSNETNKYIKEPVVGELGFILGEPIWYHSLDLSSSSKFFKTLFIPDSTSDSIESHESDKISPKTLISRNIMKQNKKFENYKKCLSDSKKFKHAVDFALSDSTVDSISSEMLQPFIDLVIKELDK